MKPNLSLAIAALFAAGAVFAQSPAVTGQQGTVVANPPEGTTALSDANVPSNTPDPNSAAASLTGDKPAPGLALPFVDEPAAATAKSDDPDELAKKVADALNAEQSLKNSKIAVTSENGLVTLTGSVATTQQLQTASRIAAAQAGDGNVVNVIQPDRISYRSPILEMRNASILTNQAEQAESGSAQPGQG
jgi:BON domain-containing protein